MLLKNWAAVTGSQWIDDLQQHLLYGALSMQVELPGVGWLWSEGPEHMHMQFDQQLLQRLGQQVMLVSQDTCCLYPHLLVHSLHT